MPTIQPDREGVVAELTVERRVDPPRHPLAEPSRAGREVVPVQHRCRTETALPWPSVFVGNEEHRRDRAVETFTQPFHDPGVEEDPDREQVGKDDPDPTGRHGTRTRARDAIRSASEAPSRPW